MQKVHAAHKSNKRMWNSFQAPWRKAKMKNEGGLEQKSTGTAQKNPEEKVKLRQRGS